MGRAAFRIVSALAISASGMLAARPVYVTGATITASGDSRPSECGSSKKSSYSIELSGSLVSCWSIFGSYFDCQEMNGSATYTELGREEFSGKFDGADITFDTQYTVTGLFPSGSCPEPKTDKEIVSGCIQYITAGGMVGLMRFYDVMFGAGAPHFFYEGTLTKT